MSTATKKISRQKAWQDKQREAGNCIRCGAPRSSNPRRKTLCDSCADQSRDYMRRRLGIER